MKEAAAAEEVKQVSKEHSTKQADKSAADGGVYNFSQVLLAAIDDSCQDNDVVEQKGDIQSENLQQSKSPPMLKTNL